MTPELEAALALWESGTLSRDELARRFPDEDIAGLLDAFDRVGAAAAGPTPDAGAAWAIVSAKLPDRLADRRKGRGKAIRLLAAATIAVLLMGATAYAFMPSVRRAMNDTAGVITGGAGPSSHPTPPGTDTGSKAEQLAPEASRLDLSEAHGEDEEAVEPESDSDPGEHDADTDWNSGSDDDSEGDSVSGGGPSGDDSGSDAEATDDSASGDEGSDDALVESESSDSGSEGSES